jgi:nitrate reductase assembly molybdenum cofactor insertion protein NarJ
LNITEDEYTNLRNSVTNYSNALTKCLQQNETNYVTMIDLLRKTSTKVKWLFGLMDDAFEEKKPASAHKRSAENA